MPPQPVEVAAVLFAVSRAKLIRRRKWSGALSLKLLKELRRCHDARVPKCAKRQEMTPVTGDKKICLRGSDTIKDAVIGRVSGEGAA